MDFSYNRDLYFPAPRPWEDFAATWDELQGREGDVYRREIILPGLKDALGDVRRMKVLDIGTGNGCVARQIARDGADVLGIDGSPSMIRLARSHVGTPGERFDTRDVLKNERLGAFDICISVFSHQDVGDLGAAFRFAARNLKAEGRFAIVYEDLDALEGADPSHYNTDRRWLDRDRRVDGSRRQLVFWKGAREEKPLAVTETTLWPGSSYDLAASRVGLEQEFPPRVLMPLKDTSASLRLYSVHPRFRLAVYRCSTKRQGIGAAPLEEGCS